MKIQYLKTVRSVSEPYLWLKIICYSEGEVRRGKARAV